MHPPKARSCACSNCISSYLATDINNRIYTLVLGNGVPAHLRNTTDETYYTHYSAISTVQANWGLKSLGRGDTNSTLNNVLEFVAKQTNWTNNGISGNDTRIRTSPHSATPSSPLHSLLTISSCTMSSFL